MFAYQYTCFKSFTFCVVALLVLFSSCKSGEKALDDLKPYKTENVIVVVIDGPRFSETWGDKSYKWIPHMANDLRPQGVFFSNFYNQGETWTNPGHTAIATGTKQAISNDGSELPKSPSIFQLWLEQKQKDSTAAWLITSKGKLKILSNSLDPAYKDKFSPALNCGIDGNGNGYRDDSLTFKAAKEILTKHKPNLVLINFKEPDHSGHRNAWNDYLTGLKASDEYVWQLWEFIQKNEHYRGKTSLLITNDHGRHPDGLADGFVSHGDGCESCRHISLLALGPDFEKGVTLNQPYEQVDIPTTIAEILDFKIPNTQGKVIKELFTDRFTE